MWGGSTRPSYESWTSYNPAESDSPGGPAGSGPPAGWVAGTSPAALRHGSGPGACLVTAVTGVVLAGGRGSRLGGVDKARLEIGGMTTLDRVRAALAGLVDETILVVNDAGLAGTAGVRIVRDPEPHAGVLPALLAALDVAAHPLCVLVACDMPFLNTGLLRWLVEAAAGRDVVIPEVGGQLQPMHAVYRREPCREAIAAALQRGDRRMISFLEGLRVRRVEEAEARLFDPELRSFFNINTAEELAEASHLALAEQPR